MKLFEKYRPLLYLFFASTLAAIIIFGVKRYVESELPRVQSETSVLNNVGFFLLVNINIGVMMVLGFIVIRNLVKLLFDRRRRILGSKLQARLVGAFVGLSLVPTILLFLVSKGILERVFEEWFSPQVSSMVESTLELASEMYQGEAVRLEGQLETLRKELRASYGYALVQLQRKGTAAAESGEVLRRYLERQRGLLGLEELGLYGATGETYLTLRDEVHAWKQKPADQRLLPLDLLPATGIVVREEDIENGRVLRGYALIEISLTKDFLAELGKSIPLNEHPTIAPTIEPEMKARFVLKGSMKPPQEIQDMLSQVLSAYDEYKELSSYRRPLGSSYMLTLIAFTVVVIFAAIWVGFYLARGLAGPIQMLARGTTEVAHGNLEYHVPEVGDDELSILVKSFNQMTTDLKTTRDELISRRRYMETVLESVGVGVVSLDKEGRITTANQAASEMLGAFAFLGKTYKEVFRPELATTITDVLGELTDQEEKIRVLNVSISVGAEVKQIQVKGTKLINDRKENLGSVLLFEDLTQLVNAQRVAAWREVARRIAHEIKNPLTPIQLSAQRIQRKFGGEDGSSRVVSDIRDREIVKQCTDTIIRQVETLRSLVNEFSRFARMPKAILQPAKLNELIAETVALYRQSEPGLEFVLELDPGIPIFDLDREQIGRVMVNLLDNAIYSVKERVKLTGQGEGLSAALPQGLTERLGQIWIFKELKLFPQVPRFQPRIKITSQFNAALGLVTVFFSDNGCGISEADRTKIFEPYFSTKQGGTGLGLAIVNSIVADHGGFVRVRENEDGGAILVVELPVASEAVRAIG